MSWKQLAVLAVVVAVYLFCIWLAERRRNRRVQPEQPPPMSGPASAALAVPEPVDYDATTQRFASPDRTPIEESLTGRVDPGRRRCVEK